MNTSVRLPLTPLLPAEPPVDDTNFAYWDEPIEAPIVSSQAGIDATSNTFQ